MPPREVMRLNIVVLNVIAQILLEANKSEGQIFLFHFCFVLSNSIVLNQIEITK